MSNDKYVAYVSSYTKNAKSKGQGIHIYDMNVEEGRVIERDSVSINNSSYVILSTDEKHLYSICDEGVTSFTILEDGSLSLLNTAGINGMRGCHLSTTRDNSYLFVSGYHDGKVTVLKINEDGSIGAITDEVFHSGLGSIAERNFRPHVSCCVLTPDEEILCVCDPGIDQIKLYEFNNSTGLLSLNYILRFHLESAPRQIMFSADGKFAYVLCELKNCIDVYSYNKDAKERFDFIQNIFTVRKNHQQNTAAASMRFSINGNHVFCTNAGDDTLTIYNVDKKTGLLTMNSSLPISGDYPKDVCIFPDCNHVISVNQDSNSLTTFTINYQKGLIVMNGKEQKIIQPNNMIIKKL
ncbi:MAG: beta-propeller fold lactonase family protein [Thermoflexaceae bacterium]|nr:beta-propeller fold lactonase family protein [Thermoflexaceae bacterium]